jgi:hypothetical protein
VSQMRPSAVRYGNLSTVVILVTGALLLGLLGPSQTAFGQNPPELQNGVCHPTEGDEGVSVYFQIEYRDQQDHAPSSATVQLRRTAGGAPVRTYAMTTATQQDYPTWEIWTTTQTVSDRGLWYVVFAFTDTDGTTTLTLGTRLNINNCPVCTELSMFPSAKGRLDVPSGVRFAATDNSTMRFSATIRDPDTAENDTIQAAQFRLVRLQGTVLVWTGPWVDMGSTDNIHWTGYYATDTLLTGVISPAYSWQVRGQDDPGAVPIHNPPNPRWSDPPYDCPSDQRFYISDREPSCGYVDQYGSSDPTGGLQVTPDDTWPGSDDAGSASSTFAFRVRYSHPDGIEPYYYHDPAGNAMSDPWSGGWSSGVVLYLEREANATVGWPQAMVPHFMVVDTGIAGQTSQHPQDYNGDNYVGGVVFRYVVEPGYSTDRETYGPEPPAMVCQALATWFRLPVLDTEPYVFGSVYRNFYTGFAEHNLKSRVDAPGAANDVTAEELVTSDGVLSYYWETNADYMPPGGDTTYTIRTETTPPASRFTALVDGALTQGGYSASLLNGSAAWLPRSGSTGGQAVPVVYHLGSPVNADVDLYRHYWPYPDMNHTRTRTTDTYDFWVQAREQSGGAPDYVILKMGAQSYFMNAQPGYGGSYAGDTGIWYQYTLSGLAAGNHTFRYESKNTLRRVYFPDRSERTLGMLRVNNRPTLSDGSVNPTTGDEDTAFTYRVRYRDLDNDAPIAAYCNVWDPDENNGDGVIDTKGASTITDNEASWTAHALQNRYVHVTRGNIGPQNTPMGWYFRIADNTATMLTLEVSPNPYVPAFARVDRAFSDLQVGDEYQVVRRTLMLPETSAPYNYAAGVYFTYTHNQLSTGLTGPKAMKYAFVFQDSWGQSDPLWGPPGEPGEFRCLPEGNGYGVPASYLSGPTLEPENTAPVLSDPTVNPTTATSNDTFRFEVTYTDLDNDFPSSIQLRVSQTADSGANNFGTWGDPVPLTEVNAADAIVTDGKRYYAEISLAYIAGTPGAEYAFTFTATDGTDPATYNTTAGATPFLGPHPPSSSYGRFGPTVTQNTAPQVQDTDWDGSEDNYLTPATGPYGPLTQLVWTAEYRDANNHAPSFVRIYLDGTPYDMPPVTPADTDYDASSDDYPPAGNEGVRYSYTTMLPIGTHTYFFLVSDGEASDRSPATGTLNIVVQNTAPTLSGGDVDPDTGTTTNTYTYRVQYTDADGDLPTGPSGYIKVVVDTTNEYALTQEDPGDPDVTDGKWYRYVHTAGLLGGSHNFYFEASDGSATAYDPAGAPGTKHPGPTVNRPPTLTDRTVTPDPFEGSQKPAAQGGTDYVIRVTYTDLDNHPPTANRVQLFVQNTTAPAGWQTYNMAVDPAAAAALRDGDYTNGERFVVTLYGVKPGDNEIGDGHHEYYLLCSDGLESARLPGTGTLDGPTVNDPPAAPTTGFDPQSPNYPTTHLDADIVTIADSTPRIRFDPGTDINGTDTAATLHYVVQLSRNKSFTPVDQELTSADGQAFVDVTTPLAEGIWYYRVKTVDDDGAQSPWSYAGGDPYNAVTLFRLDINAAPYWPGTVTAADFTPTGEITTTQPTLAWPVGTDDDPSDPPGTLQYRVEVDDNANFLSPEYQSGWLAAGVTQQAVPAGRLNVGVTYYWRVQIRDDGGAESLWTNDPAGPNLALSFNTVQNSKPNPPSGFVPTGGDPVATLKPELSWAAATDPNVSDPPATLHYEVELDDNNDWSDANIFDPTTHPGSAVTPDGVTMVTVAPSLTENQRYYYRVRTVDDQGLASDWSASQLFWVNTVNDDPNRPDSGFDPNNGEEVASLTPTLIWNPATDPDDPSPLCQQTDAPATLRYIVQLSTSNSFTPVAHQYTTPAGQATFAVPDELTDLTRWYWRVGSLDDEGAQSAWSITQYFDIDTHNTDPWLSGGGVTPVYGGLMTTYTFSVVYTDAEDDDPAGDIMLDVGGTLVRKMTRDPNDTDPYTAGVTYLVTVGGGELGLGAWTHHYYIEGTAPLIRYPVAPLTVYGPVIGSDSALRLTNASWADVTTYEEGDTVYIEVTDTDENENAAAKDALTVTVRDQGSTDVETVTLTETGNDTGIFRGSIATLGRAEQAGDPPALNVIAGPSGNTITARYADADETGNPNQDTSSDTATVRDTVAPAALAAGQLVATSGADGVTADLDWSAYDEDAQVDVAGYHVYQSENNITNTTSMTPVATVAAGTQTTTMAGLEVGEQYYFAVGPFDEVPNENHAVNAAQQTTGDTRAPYLDNESPAPDDTEVALDTSISFDICDDGGGVKQSTIVVRVNGVDVTGACAIAAKGDSVVGVAYDPPADFSYNQTVTVRVVGEDDSGNKLDTTYSFATVTDHNAPQVTGKDFSASAGYVSFHITDDVSGVDTSTIVVTVEGDDVTADCQIDDTDPLDVSVRYDVPGGWPYNAQLDFAVDCSDIAGNAMTTETWQEQSRRDDTAPQADQLSPADAATGVAVGTDISLRLRDPDSGVDQSSVTMTVEGEDVTGDLEFKQATEKGVASLEVTYDPATDLPWETEVDVHVEAADDVGNSATVEWSFTTQVQPTYSISGEIQDQDGNPLPGVQVTADGQTAVSDGNGVYRITDVVGGTHTVTPSRDEYDFAPTSRDVTVGPSAQHVDFTGTLRTYTISGNVSVAGAGLANVSVTDGARTATTDANGDYSIADVPSGTYSVTCGEDLDGDGYRDYRYTPLSQSVTVAGADVADVDFTAAPATYTISGTISDSRDNRISGVTVTATASVPSAVDGSESKQALAAVTNEAGRYTISGVRGSTVTLTPSKSGLAFDPVSSEATVPPDSTGNDFIAYQEFSHSLRAGLSMVGVPCTPPAGRRRATDVFATSSVARWDPTAVPPQYVSGAASPDHPELQVRPGAAFFVRVNGPTDLSVPGDPVADTGTFGLSLGPGWNMVGNMHETALPLANVNAVGGGQIRPFAFIYDNATGSYQLVSRLPALNALRNYLEAWEGAWFRTVGGTGTSVAVTAPTEVGSAGLVSGKEASAEVAEGGWLVPITAWAAGRADLTTLAGVGSGDDAGGYVVENPPKAPDSVDLYFTDGTGRRLAHDVRGQSAGGTVWPLVVETDLSDTRVEVMLPDLSAVPNDLAVYLVDLDANKRMYARTLPGYSFTSGENGATRHFRLEIEPRGADNLVIKSASVLPTRSSAIVTYELSKACQVSVKVLNMAGRTVRQLIQGKTVASGRGEEIWNLRSDSGAMAPGGEYLVRIEAVADNGQRVHALRQVHVTR